MSSPTVQEWALAGMLMLLAGCATVPKEAEEAHWMSYLETASQLEAEGIALEPGSEEEKRAIEHFRGLLSDFKAPDFQEKIREVYAPDIYFNDTLKTVRGLAALEQYFADSAAAVDTATVEFLDLVAQNGNYYFRWQMSLGFKRIERGRVSRSVGMSHVRFDRQGKVVLHQDFWDSTGGFFEHVPALGWMIRRIKKRL